MMTSKCFFGWSKYLIIANLDFRQGVLKIPIAFFHFWSCVCSRELSCRRIKFLIQSFVGMHVLLCQKAKSSKLHWQLSWMMSISTIPRRRSQRACEKILIDCVYVLRWILYVSCVSQSSWDRCLGTVISPLKTSKSVTPSLQKLSCILLRKKMLCSLIASNPQ